MRPQWILWISTLWLLTSIQSLGFGPWAQWAPCAWLIVLAYASLRLGTVQALIFSHLTGGVVCSFSAINIGLALMSALLISGPLILAKPLIERDSITHFSMLCMLLSLLLWPGTWVLGLILNSHAGMGFLEAKWLAQCASTTAASPLVFWFFQKLAPKQDTQVLYEYS